MVIRVLNFVSAADTGTQGAVIRNLIIDRISDTDTIAISFAGVDTATSSFVNVCFVDLLRHMSFDIIKSRIKIIDSTAQINDMIKGRLIHASSLMAA